MPEGFDRCERAGGRIRRISGPNKRWNVPAGHYRNICWDKSGVPHRGELHTKKVGDAADRKARSRL